jgi:ketosteroid isomerase-like protein
MHKIGMLLATIISLSCSDKVDVAEEEKNLLKTDREFARMSVNKGAAAAFEHYMTEDAMVLPQNNHPITGRDLIVKAFGDDPDSFKLEWTPEKAEVSESGDMGWTWGRYKQTVFTDKDDKVSYGKYLNIWEKQKDGSWRLAVDMGNKSPEP